MLVRRVRFQETTSAAIRDYSVVKLLAEPFQEKRHLLMRQIIKQKPTNWSLKSSHDYLHFSKVFEIFCYFSTNVD